MRAVHLNNDLSYQPVGSIPTRRPHDPNERAGTIMINIFAWDTGFGALFFFIYALVLIPVREGIIDSQVRDPRLEIDSLMVSNLNLSSRPNQISADWNVQMNFKTMNKHGYFNLSNVKVLVYSNDKIVGVTNVASFYISPKNPPMQFGADFYSRLSGDYIDDSMINHIAQGKNVAGTLKLDVELLASMKKTYKDWGTESWKPYLWVFKCKNVELVFGSVKASEAHMLNGSHKCKKALSAPFEDSCASRRCYF